MKLDWEYCPWCYGPGFEPSSNRQFTDVRYTGRCQNAKCTRKVLMPFMRYCPWCRRKGATQMEDPRIDAHLRPLRLGGGGRVLEPLPLVLQATWRTIGRLSAVEAISQKAEPDSLGR